MPSEWLPDVRKTNEDSLLELADHLPKEAAEALLDEVGIPDLLEKMPGKSNFGKYFYRPVDIKSGSGFADRAKGTLRNDYGIQLYHYGYLLKRFKASSHHGLRF